ncbi:MAG TPA: glycosyltransferase family 9 protein [Rhabdochlamydiaceae bacterium]|nr:glycosyltransferase family 9 protein [Rhabdochlamydiaceae bacterium]
MFKQIWRKFAPNPLDQILKRAVKENSRKFLIAWNRGLGDIPLGLYALVYRVREFVPDAEITFLTRSDLKEAFSFLKDVRVLVGVHWKRGVDFDLDRTLADLNLERSCFDVILERPDPTYWVQWQLGTMVPQLQWKRDWDGLCERFGLSDRMYIGVHVQTETNYGYQKNWPTHFWEEFFEKLSRQLNHQIILFGFQRTPVFDFPGIVDLRGKTSLFEMLSIIKNHCRVLVAPDSGVLSITYYLAEDFPIKMISLWADPNQGVLKQNVHSPNSLLVHVPLIGQNKDISQIPVETVTDIILGKL